jgi:hypothetical protein
MLWFCCDFVPTSFCFLAFRVGGVHVATYVALLCLHLESLTDVVLCKHQNKIILGQDVTMREDLLCRINTMSLELQ